jgi:hypothetical protein
LRNALHRFRTCPAVIQAPQYLGNDAVPGYTKPQQEAAANAVTVSSAAAKGLHIDSEAAHENAQRHDKFSCHGIHS